MDELEAERCHFGTELIVFVMSHDEICRAYTSSREFLVFY